MPKRRNSKLSEETSLSETTSLSEETSLADGKAIAKSGLKTIKQKETWKRVGAIAGGTMLASIGVIISNKLIDYVSEELSLRFASETVAAGAVAMLCFGMGWDNVGYGAASTTAVQAINTATTLVTGQSLVQLIN